MKNKSRILVVGVLLVGLGAEITYAKNVQVTERSQEHEWMTQTEFVQGYIALGDRDYVDGKEIGFTRYRVSCNSKNILREESVLIVRYSENGHISISYDDGGHFGFYGNPDSLVDVIEKGTNGHYPHTRLTIREDYSTNREEFDTANETLSNTRERFKSKLFELGNSELGKSENLLDCIRNIQYKK